VLVDAQPAPTPAPTVIPLPGVQRRQQQLPRRLRNDPSDPRPAPHMVAAQHRDVARSGRGHRPHRPRVTPARLRPRRRRSPTRRGGAHRLKLLQSSAGPAQRPRKRPPAPSRVTPSDTRQGPTVTNRDPLCGCDILLPESGVPAAHNGTAKCGDEQPTATTRPPPHAVPGVHPEPSNRRLF